MMHEELNYVSYAITDVKNRNCVTTVDGFIKELAKSRFECYRSFFRFGKEFFKWVNEKGTVAGYKNDCWTDVYVIDLDNPENHELARQDAIKLEKFLSDRGIVCDIAFSGNKGFHLTFPFDLDIRPSPEIPYICKQIGVLIQEESGVKIDLQIYELNRLIRATNTINTKSGLYKIPLTIEELNTSIDNIKALAKAPRKFMPRASSDKKYLADLYDKHSHSRVYTKNFHDKFPCYSKLLKGVGEGERNEACTRLANYFARKGLDITVITTFLTNWNARNTPPLPLNEINAAAKAAQEHGYRYGCQDALLKKYCDPIECPLYKNKVETQSISVYNMQESLDKYYKWVETYKDYKMTLGYPFFDRCIRLFPGLVIQVLGATSVGKTTFVSNVLLNIGRQDYCSLIITLEQSQEMITERFIQRATKSTTSEVCKMFQNYDTARDAAFRTVAEAKNIYISDESIKDMSRVKDLVGEVQLRYNKKIEVVCIDYIQLVRGAGQSLRERVTAIAQAEKQIAKELGVIVLSLSQIGRKKPTDPVDLMDAKESGAIEESADILIGLWLSSNTVDILHSKMLKNKTGRLPDGLNDLTFNRDKMEITERQIIKLS